MVVVGFICRPLPRAAKILSPHARWPRLHDTWPEFLEFQGRGKPHEATADDEITLLWKNYFSTELTSA